MRVYLDKGHGMSASLRIEPYTVGYEPDDDLIPQEKREGSLVVRGIDNEAVTFHGTLEELRQLAFMLGDALARVYCRRED